MLGSRKGTDGGKPWATTFLARRAFSSAIGELKGSTRRLDRYHRSSFGWQRLHYFTVDKALEIRGDAGCERMVVGENADPVFSAHAER